MWSGSRITIQWNIGCMYLLSSFPTLTRYSARSPGPLLNDISTARMLGANTWRMSTRTMHIARFPFPYWRDYATTSLGAVFLRRTPTADGAIRIFFDHNCAAQLHSTLYTVSSNEVSSSPSLFPAGSTVERTKQILTYRTSGAISPRHCEQPNYLD